MLLRFRLYGFLKNQRYFEPFLLLAFLDKGLTFFEIGALIALREITTNLLEVPSGAIADLLGRRRATILAFTGYLASFLVFGFAQSIAWLVPAMCLFSIGEAFRTGTHKAMIFAWLRARGREAEKTRVYGFTRSWSKLGSAVSAMLGATIVCALESYDAVFLFAAAPCALSIVNLLGYPSELDGERLPTSIGDVFRHAIDGLRDAMSRQRLRGLMLEAMGFEGVFRAAKDYLQPVIAAVAATSLTNWLDGTNWSEPQRVALLIGPIYFALHLASSIASRCAHRVVEWSGNEEHAARTIWALAATLYAGLLCTELIGSAAGSIVFFTSLHVLQNTWRPILISRFDTHGDAARGATTLSIESQSQRLATVALAPILGMVIDQTHATAQAGAFWPIGALGTVVAVTALTITKRRPDRSSS